MNGIEGSVSSYRNMTLEMQIKAIWPKNETKWKTEARGKGWKAFMKTDIIRLATSIKRTKYVRDNVIFLKPCTLFIRTKKPISLGGTCSYVSFSFKLCFLQQNCWRKPCTPGTLTKVAWIYAYLWEDCEHMQKNFRKLPITLWVLSMCNHYKRGDSELKLEFLSLFIGSYM